MSFLSKLFAPFLGKGPSGSDRYLQIYALSSRCREPVVGQVDLMNETSLDDENQGGYYVRKVLHTSGKGRCFGEVEFELWLDSKKRIVRQEVHGGRWLTAEEYEAEVSEAEAREQAEREQAEREQAEREQDARTSSEP